MNCSIRNGYEERERLMEELHVDMREVERVMLLRSVDSRWMDHIDAMDQLRDEAPTIITSPWAKFSILAIP